MIRVLVEGKDISAFVLKEGFPEAVEYSVKGEGYFDFEVRAFTFRVAEPILLEDGRFDLSAGQSVLVKVQETDEVLLRGVLDHLEDLSDGLMEVTVFPEALLLKDTVVGEETDVGEAEPALDFDTGGPLSLREIARRVLDKVNALRGTHFTIDEASCPDPSGAGDGSFFGDIVKRHRRSGILYGLWNILADALNLDWRFHFRRKADGELYAVEAEAGFFFETLWSKGDWLVWHFKIPSHKFLGIRAGQWIDWTLELPPFGIRFPTIGAKYHVYRCVGGGLERVDTREFFPLFPFFEFSPNLDQYGERIYNRSCANVAWGQVEAFLREKKYVEGSVEIFAAADADERHSYFYAEARKEGTLAEYHDLLLSFESIGEFEFAAHYRNAKAMDILKDLCVVSDRWFWVDGAGRVYLMPVGSEPAGVELSPAQVLSLRRRRHKVDWSGLFLNRYKENSDSVESWGLKLRDAEYGALERYYQRKFEGYREEVEAKVFPETGVGLMDYLAGVGWVVELKRHLLEPVIEVKAERYVAG